jgi:curved DNA-binding protein
MRGAGPGGADIYLVVEVAADPRFTRKGDDLHTKLDIDLYTAVLGGEARVPTLNGSLVLTIPPGSQPGQSIRLKGKGMPSLKSPNQHGDLFAQLNVKIPKKLSAKEKELFAQLADHARHT